MLIVAFGCLRPCGTVEVGSRGAREHEEWIWFGPNDYREETIRKGIPARAVPEHDIARPPLFTGKTVTFKATGKYDDGIRGPRDLSQRMTALITEMRTYDGKTVPVCGVLYGNDGKVGVPVFSTPYYQTPTGGAWGDAYVRFFFWPAKE